MFLLSHLFMMIYRLCFREKDIFEDLYCYLIGINLLLSIFTLSNDHNVGYITMVVLFCSILMNLVAFIAKITIQMFEDRSYKSNIPNYFLISSYTWLGICVIFQVPIVLWITYIYHFLMDIIIPFTGWSSQNVEALIGIFVSFMTVLTCCYFVSIGGTTDMRFRFNLKLSILGSLLSPIETESNSLWNVALHIFCLAYNGLIHWTRVSLQSRHQLSSATKIRYISKFENLLILIYANLIFFST